MTNGGAVSGNIALVDRGLCTFVTKVKNAQDAGAVGVIVANHLGDDILAMGGTDNSIDISSVFVGLSDGAAIKAALGSATIGANPNDPIDRDGDLDSDIIWHEYAHGLTWRMIGNMSGPMSGAIGEGVGDMLAVLINGDDRVGEYSFSNSIGIRSEPFANYSRTYGDFDGGSIHFDGVTIYDDKTFNSNIIRRDIQMVFQDPFGALNPRMTVAAIIAEPLNIHGLGDRRMRAARVVELMEAVGLSPSVADRYPHENGRAHI